MNNWIFQIITKNLPTKEYEKYTFLDGCAGSGSTSIHASDLGFNVVSNDLMQFSKCVVEGSVNLPRDKFRECLNHVNMMNNLTGIEGFFFKNFSENAGRLFFTNHNAKKIDACLSYVETIDAETSKNYLLYCLLEGISRVSNTMGVYAAFKKEFKKSALNELLLNREKTSGKCNAKTFNMDIIELLRANIVNEDILYIDPPYNNRQYGPNYHIYETLVKNDNPKIKIVKNEESKAGLRDDWIEECSSDFCNKIKAKELLKDIIKETSAKYIYISYNSDGILDLSDFELLFLNEMLLSNLTIHIKPHVRYTSDNNPKKNYNNSYLREYLIEIVR